MAHRRGLLWLVLFALIAAQTLGLMHRVFHHPVSESPATFIAEIAFQPDSASQPRSWLAALFSSHEDSSCPLYDQLGQGGMVSVPMALPLPLVPASFVLQWFQGEVLARWAALFDARGPPPVR